MAESVGGSRSESPADGPAAGRKVEDLQAAELERVPVTATGETSRTDTKTRMTRVVIKVRSVPLMSINNI